jgi:hypothetical protein
MSALPPKVAFAERDRNVRFVPKGRLMHCSNYAEFFLRFSEALS